MKSNIAEMIEIMKSMDDEGLRVFGAYLDHVMKLSPDERAAFDKKIEDKLAELEAQEA